MSSATKRDLFLLFQSVCYLFIYFLFVLRRTFSAILNKIGKSQHLASF